MMRWIYLARFFLVVPPMPLLMVGTFIVVTSAAAAVILVDPSRANRALTPLLLLQVFACSSGFDVPARRGHYDLLLTHGGARLPIAVAHWAASACPGVISWIALGGVCWLAVGSQSGTVLFSAGSVFAVLLVSTIPWATTVRLPRFSGAIGWLLILATVSLVAPDALSLDSDAWVANWSSWLQASAAALVYPPLLVGLSLPGPQALVLAPGTAFAAVAMIVAAWSVNRRDIPLEAAQ